MNKKAMVITYGCQMNVNDSAKIKAQLTKQGYEITENLKDSDLVFINTCTVREGASKKVYGKLGELKTLKKTKKDMIVGVTGCLAQEKKDEILKRAPHVNLVLGNQNIYQIPEYLSKLENDEIKHVVLVDNEDELPPRLDADFDSNFSGCVSITYGCDNFCTYCIVPYVRGRERSVPVKDIITDINNLLKKGYKEIILLGQNVNSYGKGLTNGENFAKLLKEISKIEGKFRLRFMSPHPKDFTDDVIESIIADERISRNIHLPLQAGSTSVLKKMNRGYTKEDYLKLVEKLRSKIKNIALTTDIIVGFPYETEEDFKDTLDVVEKARYENAYMFMYSKRDETPAATMEKQVSEAEKKDRLQRLIEVQTRITKEESNKYLNKEIEILVEGLSPRNKEMYIGRTDSNKVVIFKGDETLIGKFATVKINEANTWTLYGELI
ncbi:tRNA (N6-isopentenyl adenosine(37)-C2)-methylthiotransferase MiaB [Haliovirga abyssi]|uniref:tRNA-2-methylthio-N(6)-dimethylallyladenosine synthase n=1 Tax=Haliovirga abyssi TaxID=2996794 RepID=A0AAU9D2E8_9FUSO|nr:tRNA (N6-isopentenyl adenosine(37)-C2)-methylthiotransferase MiaB [Haliovirga abyssi]BDU50171.1 tRNA-2-methylthio-N(6)-dimethylallyladenosine synthase [Haliovirga abyssi]